MIVEDMWSDLGVSQRGGGQKDTLGGLNSGPDCGPPGEPARGRPRRTGGRGKNGLPVRQRSWMRKDQGPEPLPSKRPERSAATRHLCHHRAVTRSLGFTVAASTA